MNKNTKRKVKAQHNANLAHHQPRKSTLPKVARSAEEISKRISG